MAKVLEEEDDEFNILKQLLHKSSGSNNLTSQLKKEIEDGKSFFHLVAESSESGWDWLDSYVDDVCEKTSSSDVCPGGESIGAYCTALLEFRDRDLTDFLSETDLFAERYEDEVQDADYLYEVEDNPAEQYLGDFRDYCRDESASQLPCPDSGADPPAGQKLAVIGVGDLPIGCGGNQGDADYVACTNSHDNAYTQWHVDGKKGYVRDGGYCHGHPNGALRSPNGLGTIDTEGEFLLGLSNLPELQVNGDILDYDDETTYYLYIKKDQDDPVRYDLGESANRYANDCTNSPLLDIELVRWGHEGDLDGDIFGSSPSRTVRFTLWLAGEKDRKCRYYRHD